VRLRFLATERTIIAAGFAAMVAVGSLGPSAAAQPLPVVNIMPAFLDAWHRGLGKPIGERVRIMKERVFEPNEKAFAPSEFRLDDVHIAWYLKDVARLMPLMEKLSATVTRELPSYEQHFEQAFPDFKPTAPVYFLPSMLHFDGQTSNGVLRFGLDGIAEHEGDRANLGVLVSHELFHLYHYQVQASLGARPTGAIWEQLWAEGLATYVAFRLNPGATPADALLDPRLAALSAPDTSKLATLIAGDIDKSNDQAGDQYFDSGDSPGGLPPRGGYLVGFLVAAQLGQTRDLRQLAALTGEPLHAAIVAAVQSFAKTPPPLPAT